MRSPDGPGPEAVEACVVSGEGGDEESADAVTARKPSGYGATPDVQGHDDVSKATSLTNGSGSTHGAGRNGGSCRGGLEGRKGLSNGNERIGELRQVQKKASRVGRRGKGSSKAATEIRGDIGWGTSALGLAGTAAGFLWDPLDSRPFELDRIGLLQVSMIAAGIVVCFIGIFVLSTLRERTVSGPVRNGKKLPNGRAPGDDARTRSAGE